MQEKDYKFIDPTSGKEVTADEVMPELLDSAPPAMPIAVISTTHERGWHEILCSHCGAEGNASDPAWTQNAEWNWVHMCKDAHPAEGPFPAVPKES